MRARLVAALAAAATILGARAATAQVVGVDSFDPPRKLNYASPQTWVIEARFGLFMPAIDSDPAFHGATPFASTFGTGEQFRAEGELGWEALRIPHFGVFGPDIGAGYMKMSTLAKFSTPQNGQVYSGETTSLEILPTFAVAALRVDVLWRDYGIPIVPWAKVGFGLAFWRASNTVGTASYAGVLGEGHSIGSHIALGVGLNLNFLDRDTAREFDNALGVNGTYLFAEWVREDLDGLGFQSDPLRAGGTEWTFGLAVEF